MAEPEARRDPTSADRPWWDRGSSPWGDAPAGLGLVFAVGALFLVGDVGWTLLSSSGISEAKRLFGLVAIGLFVVLLGPRFGLARAERFRAGWQGVAVVAVLAAAAAAFDLVDPRSPSGYALIFLPAMAASFLRPQRLALGGIAAVSVLAWATEAVRQGSVLGPVFPALEVGYIALTIYGVGMLRRTNRELLAARHELTRLAVAEERARIARDLHDTLGHSLTVIAFKTELVGRLLPADPVRAKAEAADAEVASREALATIRETVTGFRRPTLRQELDGITATLAAAGIEPSVMEPGEALPPSVDTLLAWAVREGATNILRHSRARHASIVVGREGSEAFVELTDDGPGERAAAARRTAAAHPAPPGAGSGLIGLEERVAGSGGRIEAGPRDAGGYRLRVTIPVEVPGA